MYDRDELGNLGEGWYPVGTVQLGWWVDRDGLVGRSRLGVSMTMKTLAKFGVSCVGGLVISVGLVVESIEFGWLGWVN